MSLSNPVATAIIVVGVAVRVAAAAVLVLGPWTDQAPELAGWDVERFVEIAQADGRPWVDHPVEYPPATVAAIEAIAWGVPTSAPEVPDTDPSTVGPGTAGSVVGFHRALVLLSLVVDLAAAAVLGWRFRRATAAAYLLVGLPLIPMGFLRFDLWATLAAVVAFAGLRRGRVAVFAFATTVAALIKAWPVLLLAAAVGRRDWRAAGTAVGVGAAAGVAWLAFGEFSFGPVQQVLSLRGATGWHIESIPGNVLALTTDGVARQELNAFRIGTISPVLVTVGRVLVVAAAVATIRRRLTPAATMLVTTAALLATSALVSPQFLLWITPWVAIILARRSALDSREHRQPGESAEPLKSGEPDTPFADSGHRRERLAAWLAVGAIIITGAALAVFAPPSLGDPMPAAALLVRNGLLVATTIVGLTAGQGSGADPGQGVFRLTRQPPSKAAAR